MFSQLKALIYFSAVAFLLLLSAGCSAPQVKEISQQWPADLPKQAMISSVPFVAQDEHECGPATLSMVMGFYGQPVSLSQLVDQVYLPERQGALQVEMLAAPRRHGMVTYPLKPDLSSVLREVSAGHPVIVFQNLSLSFYPVWHYAVVIGYDQNKDEITLHSGLTAQQTLSFFTFEQLWERGQYWAMLALPANQLPVSLSGKEVASAIANLERSDPKNALLAYQTALKKWPTETFLAFGLANAHYAIGQKRAAVKAYQQLLKNHPDFADAWHNLAQVLYELGKRQAARDAIAHAIKIGGVRLAQYQALQTMIEKPPVQKH